MSESVPRRSHGTLLSLGLQPAISKDKPLVEHSMVREP
jgi:hypothetical protein